MGLSRVKISSLVCSLCIIFTASAFASEEVLGSELVIKDSTLDQDHHDATDNHVHEHSESFQDEASSRSFEERIAAIPVEVWLAGLGSVGVISLVGLLAVGAIPLLKGPHQETVLQVLVSLAVGTLVGDALIHLLPHALETGHGNDAVVWKGFVATMTIIAFYILDRILEAAGHSHSHAHAHAASDEEKLTVSTNSSRESTPDFKQQSKSSTSLYSLYNSYQSIEKQSPCSMPSSSMMVIVGDAIHNFADGLAVGAAFSMSMAAGFSTSIAVLCHELPHEVGDFALLLHSGMSVKVAIFYNCVSSIFAFIGLVVGLMLGSNGNFSTWLLSGTVGVFLYVALVSMMTELKSGGATKAILNTCGMVSGAVLLLFIGLYEHDLILLFQEEHDH